MSQYAGNDVTNVTGNVDGRYMYALRRTDQGELFFTKIDQMENGSSIQINKPGDPEQNYNDFEQGIDFFEGRDQNHEIVYPNLNYEQLRWDNRHINYYINDDGEFVLKYNEHHDYSSDVSSDGLTDYNKNFYEVTVASGTNQYGTGNKFHINGITSPTLNLYEGQTYTFGQSSVTNNTHPLRFSTSQDGSDYTDGVTVVGTPGQAGAYTQIVVAENAPSTLYVKCSNHSGMGFALSIEANVNLLMTLSDGTVTVSAGVTIIPTGLTSQGLIGQITVGLGADVFPTGVSVTGSIGDILLWQEVNTSQDPNWTRIAA